MSKLLPVLGAAAALALATASISPIPAFAAGTTSTSASTKMATPAKPKHKAVCHPTKHHKCPAKVSHKKKPATTSG
jgi:hypothetical protein